MLLFKFLHNEHHLYIFNTDVKCQVVPGSIQDRFCTILYVYDLGFDEEKKNFILSSRNLPQSIKPEVRFG